ncbi:hypothetical protein V6N12_002064 [Hibiscus sabdariffa]|uniref:Uncharacterized protein n=1 Tax=Hibiscus sabdariffa TaxID=183260 RepID=A0ABR2A181_9ROSI
MVDILVFTSFGFISPYTDSAKASRRQLKDAILTVLFDMNVPAVCAVTRQSGTSLVSKLHLLFRSSAKKSFMSVQLDKIQADALDYLSLNP